MANNPITGPVPPDEFRTLVDLPHGEATKLIREKYDPQFGRTPGEKFTWKVTGRREDTVVAYVEAASQEEADELADELNDAAFDGAYDSDVEIISVEPDKPRSYGSKT